MSAWTRPDFDLTYEMEFDGDLGAPMTIDVHGHVDFFDQELVIADIAEDEFAGQANCFEVERLWRKQYPAADFDGDERWTYGYTAHDIADSIAVTRFQIARYWSHLCVNHPDELATTGVHKTEVEFDEQHLADGDYVYLCKPCLTTFRARLEAKRAEALA